MQQIPALSMDRQSARVSSGEGIAINLNAPQVFDKSGAPVRLGEELSRTGQAAIYQVAGDNRVAAKIFHGGTSPHLTSRLNGMAQIESAELRRVASWPMGLVYPKGSEQPIGFLMPLQTARSSVESLYSPKARRAHFTRGDWKFLIRAAINISATFDAVHKAGCVMGSINPTSLLIGQDASVRLADCDSLQINLESSLTSGQTSLETLTPPELQGKPFGGLIREVNHDNFGLAVLVFQLLFMGRHPFAGRFLGGGDMPIAKAIAEFRFAYGTRRNAHLMEQPPSTPALSIVGHELSSLFERAFGKSAVKGGRPTPREWIFALSRLEQEVAPCRIESSHWHRLGSPCPWCRVENDSGSSPRFLAEEVAPTGGPGFEILWKEAEGLEPPRGAPAVALLDSTPSEAALAIRRKGNYGHLAAFVIAVTLIGIGFLSKTEAIHSIWFVAGVVAFFIMHGIFDTASDEAALKRRLDRAKFKWEAAEAEWVLRTSADEFSRQKASLQTLRERWDQLPALSRRKHDEIKQNQWALQRRRFLDGFLITDARIDGMTTERRAFLASYGIETAADLDIARFNAVPGLPTRTLDSLMAWRTSIERDFLFNPNLPVDPADTARVDRELLAERRRLENQMRNGLATLKQIRRDIETARRTLKEPTERAYRYYAQAQIDAAVIA